MGRSRGKARHLWTRVVVVDLVRSGRIWDFLDRLDMRCERGQSEQHRKFLERNRFGSKTKSSVGRVNIQMPMNG